MCIGQHHYLHAIILPGVPSAPGTGQPRAEVAGGVFELASFSRGDAGQAAVVAERYADLRVGIADASIVLAARYRTTRLLTFDERHFRAIKPLYGEAFTILPADADAGDVHLAADTRPADARPGAGAPPGDA
jgi:hypothetical protein